MSETTPPQAQTWQNWPLRFTGSGSEYFRIWIVNLLLTLMTLTLYWPFARARKLCYFYSNTWIGPHDALGFHADAWKMFRGYVLMVVLGIGYWVVSHFLPQWQWVPFFVLALLWPALWRSSLMFRTRNTSYRGLRFDFHGNLKDAYLAMLPLFIPGIAITLWSLWTLGHPGTQASNAQESMRFLLGSAVITAISVAILPWLLARMYGYQFGGYAYANQRSACRASTLLKPIYGLSVKIIGLYVLLVLVVSLGMVAGFAAMGAMKWKSPQPAFTTLGLLLYAGIITVTAYYQSRSQNLLWGRTSSDDMRIESALGFRDVLTVSALNWLLIVVTLGLYWPFAAVRSARVRLQAVTVLVHGDMNLWQGQHAQSAGVLGDAAGDFFGLDMGL